LLQFVILGAFVTFSLRLWHLQVVAGSHYSELAGRNRTRLIASDTPRGVIYDRTHELLVRNAPHFDVLLIPAYLPENDDAGDAILQRLHELLDVPLVSDLAPPPFPPYRGSAKLGLRDLVAQGSLYAPHKPIILKKGVPLEIVFIVEEEHLDLPGVLVEVYSHREYLTDSLTAHLLGHVGPIPSGAGDRYGKEQGYAASDKVGLTGLEYAYEDVLRGQKGTKTIEVDVAGREVRTIQAIPSRAGHNLILTLDLDLQRYVEQVLRDGMQQVGSRSAVAIVTKVNTGEVLAMVSLPTYDNNLFAQGISSRDFTRLNTDPAHPMLNHAITGQYPPGSTFKLAPAAAALEEEIVERWTLLTCPSDSGILYLPNKYYPDNPELAQPFYCWTAKWGYGHGQVDFISAIAVSCDIYFYTIGGGLPDRLEGLGLERLRTYAEAFGYGSVTGIDLPAEAPGRVPDEQWKRVTRSERWTTGDTYNMAIGQGDVLATPLQVVNATAAIANGGTLYRPQFIYQVLDTEGNIARDVEPQVIRKLPISEDNLKLVREGMRAVVERGTAQGLQVGGGLKVAAKTGTSEFYDSSIPADQDGNLPTHSWFTSFAPYENPEIAVVVFVYNGGEGAATAMPIAADILNYYFRND
jgi:penicillin-binding protein 2